MVVEVQVGSSAGDEGLPHLLGVGAFGAVNSGRPHT